MAQVSLSILSSDFLHLGSEIDRLEPFVDRLHYDVMDGHFVKDVSFGLPVLKQLKTKLPIDVHLMVTNPLEVVESYAEYGDTIYFHVEASKEQTTEVSQKIRDKGRNAGLVISPETTVAAIEKYLPELTHVLVMTVRPGAGGQTYLPETLVKIQELKEKKPSLIVMVDGGMNAETAPEARRMGVDIIVSGSYLIKAPNSKAATDSIRG